MGALHIGFHQGFMAFQANNYNFIQILFNTLAKKQYCAQGLSSIWSNEHPLLETRSTFSTYYEHRVIPLLKRLTKNTRCAGLIDIYSIQCFLEAPLLLSTDVIRWCFSLTFGRFEPTLGLPGIMALEPRIVYSLLALELGWTGMKDCFFPTLTLTTDDFEKSNNIFCIALSLLGRRSTLLL